MKYSHLRIKFVTSISTNIKFKKTKNFPLQSINTIHNQTYSKCVKSHMCIKEIKLLKSNNIYIDTS